MTKTNDVLFERKTKQQESDIQKWIKCKDNKGIRICISKLGYELSIVNNNYCCSKCKSETKLQIHHIISRKYKQYLSEDEYFKKRYVWNNLILLCSYCHEELHITHRNISTNLCIKQERIKLIRKKYTNPIYFSDAKPISDFKIKISITKNTTPKTINQLHKEWMCRQIPQEKRHLL